MLENSQSEIELADKSQCDTTSNYNYNYNTDSNIELTKLEQNKQCNKRLRDATESSDSVIKAFSDALQREQGNSMNILVDFLNKTNTIHV